MGSLILSIQNSGVMEPVILRRRDDGEYQLLSGYRRVAASERAGKKDIPAFVYEMTMQEAIAYAGDIRIPLARVIKLIRHIVICIKSTTNNYFDTIT